MFGRSVSDQDVQLLDEGQIDNEELINEYHLRDKKRPKYIRAICDLGGFNIYN